MSEEAESKVSRADEPCDNPPQEPCEEVRRLLHLLNVILPLCSCGDTEHCITCEIRRRVKCLTPTP